MTNLPQQPAMASETFPEAPVGEQRASALWKTALKIGFAALLIGWMVREGALDFGVIKRLASPGLIVFCLAVVFGQIFINNYRWLSLLRGQGFDTSTKKTLPLSLIGMFFNFAMPGGVGGDVVKGYYLVQDHRDKKVAAVISIFMDRMMGFFVMIGTAFLALFMNWNLVSHNAQLTSLAVAVSLLFLAFLVFFFISFSTVLQRSGLGPWVFDRIPLGGKFKKVYEAIHEYRKAPRALVIAVICSLVNQVLAVAFVVAVARAMGIDQIPIAIYFFLVPIGTVVTALPISPAGIGVGQMAFYFLFNLYLGQESQLGPTAVTLQQIINFAWGMAGAFFYLRRRK